MRAGPAAEMLARVQLSPDAATRAAAALETAADLATALPWPRNTTPNRTARSKAKDVSRGRGAD